MEKRRFHFKRFVIAQAILIPIVTFSMWYLKLFPPPQGFCVDVRKGVAVKLYDRNCKQPSQINIVEQ